VGVKRRGVHEPPTVDINLFDRSHIGEESDKRDDILSNQHLCKCV